MSKQTDEVMSEIPVAQPPRHKKSGMAVLLLTLAILVLAGVFCYGYFQLTQVNGSLTSMVSAAETQAAAAQKNVTAMQQSIQDLQQWQQKTQDISGKQEQMLAEWQAAQKGDLDKWYAAEAQYLVKLANDHLQFTHDYTMTMTLLQRADQTLQNIQDANLMEIRKSLAADIANVQAAPHPNITDMYLHLTGLNNQVDQLSLPVNPLQADVNQPSAETAPADLPWWKAGLNQTWKVLRQIVIVRHVGPNAMPLVLPDEKLFLYQNLHAQLENAMWGVLHRQTDVYHTSLKQAIAWIKQYFNQDLPATKNLLQNLQEMQGMDIQPAAINLSATMRLFDQYFAQKGQVKAV